MYLKETEHNSQADWDSITELDNLNKFFTSNLYSSSVYNEHVH